MTLAYRHAPGNGIITWAQGIYLIYMPKPEACSPECAGYSYNRQIPRVHIITDIIIPLKVL